MAKILKLSTTIFYFNITVFSYIYSTKCSYKFIIEIFITISQLFLVPIFIKISCELENEQPEGDDATIFDTEPV